MQTYVSKNIHKKLDNILNTKGYKITAYPVTKSGWNNLTSYIANDAPLIASELNPTPGKKGHAYTVLGSRVNNGNREIYVQTGISLLPYTWVSWSVISEAKAFVIN